MSAARILLIEDDRVVAKVVSWQLEREGYLVEHVTEAGSARTAVRGILPNLIILDVGLPTRDANSPIWDGLDFLEWLEWMNIEVPVIIHSSSSPLVLQLRRRSALVVAYLQKPTRPAQLLAAVSAALHRATTTEPAEDGGPPSDAPATNETTLRSLPPADMGEQECPRSTNPG